MTKFLSREKLSSEIRRVTKGDNLRCAVAFWGAGAVDAFFSENGVPSNARLICDISMGGSNPIALECLGAPENLNLRHYQGLHAKVYLSDDGLITTSSNASNNGIGFSGSANLVEAGTFHGPMSAAYKEAISWFENLWSQSEPLNERALDAAREAWKQQLSSTKINFARKTDPESLIDTVLADPARFRGIGFVFTSSNATKPERDDAAVVMICQDESRDVRLLDAQQEQLIKSWPIKHVFSEWKSTDVSAWPKNFISIHKQGQTISYCCYSREHDVVLKGDRGTVFASRNGQLRTELGLLNGMAKMAKVDQARLNLIYEHFLPGCHKLCENGEILKEFLADL